MAQPTSSLLSSGKHTIKLNDLDIQYTVRGEGPPVILQLPGWGINRSLYTSSFEPLEAHYTVIYLATRGCDGSERPSEPDGMTSPFMASDLEQLRDHLGLSKLNLFGHSDGGVISMAYAILYPDRVDHLLLCNSDLLGYKRKDLSFWDKMNPIRAEENPQNDTEFKKFLLRGLPIYFYDPEPYMASLENHWPDEPTYWASVARYPQDHASGWFDASGWVMQDDLHKIKAKTLIVTGKQDPCCGPEVSETIAQGIQGSQLCLLDTCGHFPWLEARDEYFSKILTFLKE